MGGNDKVKERVKKITSSRISEYKADKIYSALSDNGWPITIEKTLVGKTWLVSTTFNESEFPIYLVSDIYSGYNVTVFIRWRK